MPIIKKFAPFQDLTTFNTFLVGGTTPSEYLRISDFPDTFTGGKNAFLIEGSEFLKPGTEVKLEVLDPNGVPIYFEPGNGIPEYYEGVSKVVSIHVYDDTPIGTATVTILAELKEYLDIDGQVRSIPEEWRGRYNLKWERQVQVNRKLPNTTKVRFYRRPKINIEELVKPIFTKSFPTVTQTGTISGFGENPPEGTDVTKYTANTLYRLQRETGPTFTQSIDEDIINIPSLNYSPTVREVLNQNEVLVELPYTENNIITNFSGQSYTSSFTYTEASDVFESAITGSFAKIKITDLKTFAGDVARLKIFRKSRNQVSDYELAQDVRLESTELLRDIETPTDTEIPYGNLTQENVKNYWVTSSNDHTLSIDSEFLYNSITFDYNDVIGGVQRFITSESIDFSNNVEYTLDYKTRLSGSLSSDKSIRTYISSSDFIQDISTLQGSSTLNTRRDISNNFITQYSGSAKLVFEVEGEGWYISSVSLKHAQETSFSPDEVTLIQGVPRKLPVETFDFIFEFYDINNNFIPVEVTATKEFDGGNDTDTDRTQKFLTFESDRTAFRFTTGSLGNPPFQQVGFRVTRNLLTGSVTYTSQAFDTDGNLLTDGDYVGGQYPGLLTNPSDTGATLTIGNFTGSRNDILVGSIIYTASLEDFEEFETIYRFEDGDNAPALFTTSNTNQFIYEPTSLRPKPSGQQVRIQAQRKNLGTLVTPIEVNSGSGTPPLTEGLTSNGITNYSVTATTFSASYAGAQGAFPEVTYEFTSSDQFGNQFTDEVTVSPVINFDGISVVLSNESTAFSSDSTGFVTTDGYDEGDGFVNVNIGDTAIQHNDGLNTRNTFDIVSVSGTNVTPNSTSPTTNSYGVSDMSSNSGSLELQIDYLAGDNATSASFLKKVNYTKARVSAPVISIQTTNKDQTVTGNSQGAQLDSFENSVVSVFETYLGTTSQISLLDSLTATSPQLSSIITNATTGEITLNGRTLDSGSSGTVVSITADVTDSEGQSRTVADSISLSKIRNTAPSLNLTINPRGQSVSAKSNGVQIDSFENVSVSVDESYLGVSSSLDIVGLNASSNELSSIVTTTGTTGSVILNGRTLPSGSNSTIINVEAEVVDSEAVTRFITGTLTLSKLKNSAPNVLVTASPQSQTISADRDGNQTGTPLDVRISATEGDVDVFDSMSVSGSSGLVSAPSISGDVVLTSGVTLNSNDASVTLTVVYTNSEGIQYDQDITITLSLSVEGDLGVTGPGIVARGFYDSGTTYQYTDVFPGRRDAVIYTDGNYYATLQPTTGNPPTTGTDNAYWQFLGAEDFFVAAEILITKNSFVQQVLNIGTNLAGDSANITIDGSTATPYISMGQAGTGAGIGYGNDGVYLDSFGTWDNRFSLVGSNGSLTWNGDTLNITGDITVTNAGDFAPTDAEANPDNYSFGPSADYPLTAFTPSTTGLYLGSSNMGYWNGTQWKTYMASNGDFFLSGDSGGGLSWDASTNSLSITGDITVTNSGDFAPVNAQPNPLNYSFGPDGDFDLVDFPSTPNSAGLYLGSIYMGYHNGSSWQTYMRNNGDFYLGGTGGSLQWDSSQDDLTVSGTIISTDGNIGGWTINSDYLNRGDIFIGNNISQYQTTNEQIFLGFANNNSVPYLRLQKDGNNYVQIAPTFGDFFEIRSGGTQTLVVTNSGLTVKGTIQADSGYLDDLNITGTLTIGASGEITNSASSPDFIIDDNGFRVNGASSYSEPKSFSLYQGSSTRVGDLSSYSISTPSGTATGVQLRGQPGYPVQVISSAGVDIQASGITGGGGSVTIRSLDNNVEISCFSNGKKIELDADNIRLGTGGSTNIGFRGATPQGVKLISGSYGGSTALPQLLSALDEMGLIIDST